MRSVRSACAIAVFVAALAGCTAHTAGRPSFAGSGPPADLPTGGGIDSPSASGSTSPGAPGRSSASGSDSPSGSESGSSHGSGPGASGSADGGLSPAQVADKICDAVSASQLRRIFGGPAQASPGIAYQCTFTGQGTTVLVYEFAGATLNGSGAEGQHPRRTTIGGHPAVVDGGTLSIAETGDPDDPGLLRGLTHTGRSSVTRALLERILPVFAHD